MGAELSPAQLDSLQKKLPAYKLGNTKLIVRQGLNAKNELDMSQIKASILEAVYQSDSTGQKANTYNSIDRPIPDLKDELKSLYPGLQTYSINHVLFRRLDTGKADTLTLAVMNFKGSIGRTERMRMALWLKNRIKADSLQLIVQ